MPKVFFCPLWRRYIKNRSKICICKKKDVSLRANMRERAAAREMRGEKLKVKGERRRL